MKRHELGRGAMGGLSSLYASTENEAHRKPGGGHGDGRRKRRPIAVAGKDVEHEDGSITREATPPPKPTKLPGVYEAPARKY